MQYVMSVDDVYAFALTVPRPRLRLWQTHHTSSFIFKGNDPTFPGYLSIPEFVELGVIGTFAAEFGVPPQLRCLIES